MGPKNKGLAGVLKSDRVKGTENVKEKCLPTPYQLYNARAIRSHRWNVSSSSLCVQALFHVTTVAYDDSTND